MENEGSEKETTKMNNILFFSAMIAFFPIFRFYAFLFSKYANLNAVSHYQNWSEPNLSCGALGNPIRIHV